MRNFQASTSNIIEFTGSKKDIPELSQISLSGVIIQDIGCKVETVLTGGKVANESDKRGYWKKKMEDLLKM